MTEVVGEGVEGKWKKFVFKLITKEDYPAVLRHLIVNFYVDSPLSIVTGTSEAKLRDIEKITKATLDDGLSFAVIEEETGKIAGVRVTARCRKGKKPPTTYESEEYRTIERFLAAAEDGIIDYFQKYNVEEYADLCIASVDREFRGEGIASEMYRRVLPFLRAQGFKLAKSSFTSPYTMKIAERYGFEEVSRKYFREIRDEQGQLTHSHLGDELFVAIKCLRL